MTCSYKVMRKRKTLYKTEIIKIAYFLLQYATVINLFKVAKTCLLSLATIHAFLVSHALQHIEHSRYSANIQLKKEL